ncbi:MAG: M3 family oligoendopeptidase [Chloroflexi bacterium]|nr:M3 family oligoendopeptidase [Chloroflexota bacterium]
MTNKADSLQQIAITQEKWCLEELFPGADSPEFENAKTALIEKVATFTKVRSLLNPDIDTKTFLDIIAQLEVITEESYRIYGFAGLWFSEDTQNQLAQGLQAQVQQIMAELTNRTLFFSLWWKGLDDENAERLMAVAGDCRYWLEEMRHFKPHTLSEDEEKIINIKDVTGVNALTALYDTITNRYVFRIEIEGEVKEMTRGELMVLARSTDPELRAAAYQELYRVYGERGVILGQMYQTRARDWQNEQIELRRFQSPIAARNLQNDIPDDVVETLLDLARENAPVFQRFFRLKARWLGMEKLRRYDIYAPVVEADKTYDFAEAADMVFDAFYEFEPQIAHLARRVFAEKHVDSEVRQGKRGGAFCWTVSSRFSPWVLVNYQGKANDVSTLAHELGHAVHSMLAAHHSIFTQHASLPLAETASTFAEMLLVDYLLGREEDENVRRDILFSQVDDAYATIMRQAYFALFEREAHDRIAEGAAVDELSAVYLQNLATQFGDSVEVPEEFRWEWISIPHIYHVPFYVYSYAFGQLLVLALYQQYKKEGDSFKARYLDILSAGGSQSPANILRQAGIDIHRRDFWQGGFDIISDLVDQLETIPIPDP